MVVMEEMVRSVLATMLANLIPANVMPPPPNPAQPRQAEDEEERRWIKLDKAYPTPSKTRIYKDHEKLEGSKNYKSWLEMIQLDLRAVFLQPFIKELAQEKVSLGRRRALDAQAVQQIRSSLPQKVLMMVGPVNSAFELMEQLKRDHGSDKLNDRVDVHRSWAHLKFKQGFEQRRFVYDFNKIVKRFLEHDVIHSDPYLVTSFITRLEGINDLQSAMYFFYKH